jgi:hypothetical protein
LFLYGIITTLNIAIKNFAVQYCGDKMDNDVSPEIVEAILNKWKRIQLDSPYPEKASPNWELPIFVCTYQSFLNLKSEIPDGVFSKISARKKELPDTATDDIYIAFQVVKAGSISARFRFLDGTQESLN